MSQRFLATKHDAFFPQRLRHDPEICRFVEAEGPLSEALDHLPAAVAIVGTRAAPEEAKRFTRWFARELARVGVVIISGGAFGVDAAAHEGALDVDGRTIAVIGGSLDKLYPEEHAGLYARIRASGAVVSMCPRGTSMKNPFLRRNAVIAALASDVVVTCAGIASGALNTAGHAIRLKRRLWVVPGAPWEASTEGQAIQLARRFGQAIVEPNPVLKALKKDEKVRRSFLRWQVQGEGKDRRHVRVLPNLDCSDLESPVGRPRKPRAAPERVDPASTFPAPRRTLETCESILPSEDERRVVQALREGPASIDELVLQTGLGVPSLRGLLLTWTVEGVVREGPAGLFRLATY